MTTRRSVLLLSALSAAAAAGCRAKPVAAATPVPDVLLADSTQGLVRLSGTGTQRFGAASQLSSDGNAAYAVTPPGAGPPKLQRLDLAGGAPIRSSAIGGGWVPRAISADGRSCALGRSAATDRPAARDRTPLLVVTESGRREYDLPGVVEPDAFSQDGTGLFVLDWLPARAPDHYRVRLLELSTGRLQPLYTRNKVPVPAGAEEEMRGSGRQAVLSADRQVLYTLYTHQPDHQHTRDLIAGTRSNVHAFVHVLHLVELWAFCLDLPDPFGTGPVESYALAADGQHIAVADMAHGLLAYASVSTLEMVRVARIPAAAGAASLLLAPDRRVFAAAGPSVTVLDRVSDAVSARWPVPSAVRGLALTRDGSRLYAGGADEVVWLDTASGTRLGQARLDGLTAVRHIS